MGHDYSPTILVVGDLMLDRWYWGKTVKHTSESGEPRPVVRINRSAMTLGGAGNVAVNLSRLGATSILVTRLPQAIFTDVALGLCAQEGIECLGPQDDSACIKTRIVAEQMTRFDIEPHEPMSLESEQEILNHVEAQAPHCDAIVVSDYLKGVCTEAVLRCCLDRLMLTVVDPKLVDRRPVLADFRRYRGAAYIKPNLSELLVGDYAREETAAKIMAETGAALVVTQGAAGAHVWSKDESFHVDASHVEFKNAIGAGDVLTAALAFFLSNGQSLRYSVEGAVGLASESCCNELACIPRPENEK